LLVDLVTVKESFMAISVRNAFRAGSSDSLDELRETIASLESQVTSMYEEKEAEGMTSCGGDSDGLVALYEQKVALSNRTVADLQMALSSFEEQLAGLYADREVHADSPVGDLSDALASLEAQVVSLYAEKEEAVAAAFFSGFRGELTGLYNEGGHQSDLPAIVEGLEAQLHALYREREEEGDVAAQYGSPNAGDMAAMILSFEEQLAGFYEVQAAHAYGVAEANQMVQSLEPQVSALIEERNDLADALQAKEAELERSRSKAKEMVAALMEQALA
jgi:uncharacterized protein YoxC